MRKSEILKQALTQSGVNGIIAGVQAWFSMRALDSLPLTLDTIAGGRSSLMGTSVAKAFTEGLAITLVTYWTFRKRLARDPLPGLHMTRLKFWPDYVILATKNAIFVFGLLIMIGIMWQYWIGTVLIIPAVGMAIIVLIAMVQTGYTSYSTMVSMLELALVPDEAFSCRKL